MYSCHLFLISSVSARCIAFLSFIVSIVAWNVLLVSLIFLKRWEYHTTLPASWETYMQVNKQQLELYMEQWTGSKLGKEYMLEMISESPLDCKAIQPVHSKGDQSWVFIGRTDVEAETPILWPPDLKSWLIWKDPDAGKDWGQKQKGTTEDEMVGWHHQLNGHGFG